MTRLLVVDDSALVRRLIRQVFAGEADFELAFACNGAEALTHLHRFRPDVVTLDLTMPVMDGLACLDRIMIERPCPVIVMSSIDRAGEATVEALRLGAVDIVAKPRGAASLRMAEWGPELIAKVRSAAAARVSLSARLRERVRHRVARMATPRSSPPSRTTTEAFATALSTGAEALVLVGASTGGPPALEALLSALPATFPCPVLIAQHMPASFTGALARRLDSSCALTVREVLEPVRLKAGTAYIGRGDLDLVVGRRSDGLVAMPTPPLPAYPWRPSVDRLVRSAMDHVPAARLLGVLMTGMGDDGAAAMTALHHAGGRTIAEAEESAVVWGMPRELVMAGGADWIVPLGCIAERLQALVA